MKAARLHRVAFTPDPDAPDPVTVEEARHMSVGRRRSKAAEVHRYLSGLYFDSDRDRDIRSRLTSLAETNAASLVGTQDVAIVTGDNVLGKSTMLYQVAYEAHRRHVAPHTDPDTRPAMATTRTMPGGRREDLRVSHAPALFLSLGSGTTASKFNGAVVSALDYEDNSTSRAAYLDLLERHGVRLLIVDDLHLLKTSLKQGREALDHLKAVVTAVGEFGATVVFAGANLHTHPVMDDPQVTGRAYEIPVAPYTADSQEERLTFQRFLRECATQIQPYLPLAAPDHIHNGLPKLLLARSAGYHRDILRLLQDATAAAITDGTWAITEKHITHVDLTARGQRREAAARAERRVTPIAAPGRAARR